MEDNFNVNNPNLAAEMVSLENDSMRASFFEWLSNGHAKKYAPETCLSCLDKVSEYAKVRKICAYSLWNITQQSVFKPVYQKLLDAKLFRIADKAAYRVFIEVGKLYLKFLKDKPWKNSLGESYVIHHDITTNEKTLAGAAVESSLPGTIVSSVTMTIKDAVIEVLKRASRAMTAEEIYNRVIEQGLYSFGAQNPANVIRTTIEYACDNSGYSNKDTVPYFHFDKNTEGKRIYSLLKNIRVENFEMDATIPDDLPQMPDFDLAIWDINTEQVFQKWLENEGYAQRTADNYRQAAAQIFRGFAALATKAINQSKSELEAVRNYITLLNEDAGFVEANATRHNQFTAAMAALERFFSADVEIAEQITKPPEITHLPTSSLGNIVDLEEGREGLREILEAHFQTLYGYSNISIVWNAAQDNLSLFLNDNAINTAEALWRFMYRVFLGDYVMSNPHIWKTQPNHPQSYVGVIINLARQFGGAVTKEQIDEYFSRIKQGSPINATIIRQGYIAFYAPKHFILTEVVNLSSERVTAIIKALDRLFERERVSYIVLRDISDDWFSSLPTLKSNLNWTPLLLQEVLRLRPAIGYRTVFSGLEGQALDTLGAAIVPSKSEINSFADVAHRHCYKNELMGKKMLSEDLRIILRDAGMLEGNELIYNLHKALRDYRFAFTDENRMVKILER
jgi:hypothetical protein